MATQEDGPEITLKASGNLSSHQFKIMTLDTDGKVKLATTSNSAIEAMLGILQDKPDATDKPAVVRVAGIAKVEAGASINEGVWVTCDGNGLLAAASAADNVIGFTIDAAVSGEVARILLKQGSGYVVPA